MARPMFYKNSVVTFSDLENRSKRNPETDCIEWQKGRSLDGYGRVKYRNERYSAHRLSWILTKGEIPKGKSVLHRCDNPPCINPDHLFIGDNFDNMADRKAKGRAPSQKGSANGHARLTNDIVVAIRNAEGTQKSIGIRFGVSQATVSYLKTKKRWPHI